MFSVSIYQQLYQEDASCRSTLISFLIPTRIICIILLCYLKQNQVFSITDMKDY